MAISTVLSYPITSLLVAYITYLAGLVVYRLYFHPLAKFPGPKYAAISRWHEFYYEVVKKGQFTFKVQELHRKYGPIVRIVPDEIHIQDSQFYDTLYTKAGRVDKYDWMAGRFGCDTSVFTTGPDELHRIRRGALNPLFSRARILDLQTIIRAKIDTLLDRIREFQREDKVLPINRAFMALTGDVVMEYCFSISYDHLKLPNFEKTLHEPFMAASISGHLSLQCPWVPKVLFTLPESILVKIEPLYALVFRMQADFRKQINAMKEGKMNDVLAKSTHPTVFQELISGNLPPSEKETRRLQDEAQLVVAAGVTTTGWALSVATFHLLSNRDVLAKLKAELKNAIPDPSAPLSWVELEKLPYLTGCVREAVRMSYAVTTRNPRLFSKPITYNDWVIPPRTPVSMTIVDVNDDEDIFPEPRKFRPERWIGSPKAPDGSSLERYFVGFGKGTRSCLGINLAHAELYMTLAAVFRNFDFELYETDISDVELAHDFFLPSPKLDSKGVRVKVLKST
ncbi:Cytochrome P450 monooxygenase sdnE [Exophiala dermatitidis]